MTIVTTLQALEHIRVPYAQCDHTRENCCLNTAWNPLEPELLPGIPPLWCPGISSLFWFQGFRAYVSQTWSASSTPCGNDVLLMRPRTFTCGIFSSFLCSLCLNGCFLRLLATAGINSIVRIIKNLGDCLIKSQSLRLNTPLPDTLAKCEDFKMLFKDLARASFREDKGRAWAQGSRHSPPPVAGLQSRLSS